MTRTLSGHGCHLNVRVVSNVLQSSETTARVQPRVKVVPFSTARRSGVPGVGVGIDAGKGERPGRHWPVVRREDDGCAVPAHQEVHRNHGFRDHTPAAAVKPVVHPCPIGGICSDLGR